MGYFKYLLQEHQKDEHNGLVARVIKIGCEGCEDELECHQCDKKDDDELKEEKIVTNVKIEETDLKDKDLEINPSTQGRFACSGCDNTYHMRKTVNRHQKEKHPSKKLDVYKIGCLCFEHKFDHNICQTKSLSRESQMLNV